MVQVSLTAWWSAALLGKSRGPRHSCLSLSRVMISYSGDIVASLEERLADDVLLEGVISPSLGTLRINRLTDMGWRWIFPLIYQLQREFSQSPQLLLHSVIMAKGCYAFSISTCAPAMTHLCEDEEFFQPTSAVSSQVTIVWSMNVILMASPDVTRHGRSM